MHYPDLVLFLQCPNTCFTLHSRTSSVFLRHPDLVLWAMVDLIPQRNFLVHDFSVFSCGFLYQISILLVFHTCAPKNPSDNSLFSSLPTSQSACCKSLRCQALQHTLTPPAPISRSATLFTQGCLPLHLHSLQVPEPSLRAWYLRIGFWTGRYGFEARFPSY